VNNQNRKYQDRPRIARAACTLKHTLLSKVHSSTPTLQPADLLGLLLKRSLLVLSIGVLLQENKIKAA